MDILVEVFKYDNNNHCWIYKNYDEEYFLKIGTNNDTSFIEKKFSSYSAALTYAGNIEYYLK